MSALIHSPACDRNQGPILDVLRTRFAHVQRVLEIGSGTGQHAVHFASALPHLQWQCTDVESNLPFVRARLDAAGLPNTPAPLVFDVDGPWPTARFDAVFSANTLHIMSWPQVQRLFAGLPSLLMPEAVMTFYGPFNLNGQFTSDSNRQFDQALRQGDARRGIRNLEAVQALATAAGLVPLADVAMPSNNRCISWRN